MSNYRIVRISGISHYPKAVKAFKNANRGIERRSYKTQMETLARFGFMYGASFSEAMRSLGNQAEEIVYDLDVMQKTWARENGVSYGDETWMVDILLKQIEFIRPDVIYLQGHMPLPGFYRKSLKRMFSSVKLVVMHYGFPVHPSQLNGVDLILAAAPPIHDYFDRHGADSRLVYHAFNPGVLSHLGMDIPARQNSLYDFTFAGASGFMLDMMGNPTAFSAHKSRYKFLEEMIKKAGLKVWEDDNSDLYGTVTSVKALRGVESIAMDWLESRNEKDLIKALSRKNLGDVHIGKELVRRARGMLSRRAAGPLSKDIPVQALKDIYPESCYPPVFGLGMYQVLARSRITFNIHTDEAKNNVGNIRMFDATGVGACLLTDRGANMADLFDEDYEVATYSSIDECVEKAKYLLDHDDERRKIALAGRRRTLRDHTVKSRCEMIHTIIQERLRKGASIVKSQMIKTPKTGLGKVEHASTWGRGESSLNVAAFFLELWIKTGSLADDLVTAAKIAACPRKRGETNLDKINHSSKGGKLETITVTMTARPGQIKGIVNSLQSRFPDASFVLISKEGQKVNIDDSAKEADSVYSLPEGMFRFTNVPASILTTRKKIKPDLMVLAYNNPEGHGYFALECFVLLCGARRAIGVFEGAIVKEISFRHALGYIMNMMARGLFIYPFTMLSFASYYFAAKTWAWLLRRFKTI